MNTYKVSYLHKRQLVNKVDIIDADNETEAAASVKRIGMRIKVELAHTGDVAMSGIVDAEELLYEMDATNTDEIIVTEGLYGNSKTVVVREEVESRLNV